MDLAPLLGQLAEFSISVFEEHFVGDAEVAQSFVRGIPDAILGAAAEAHLYPPAIQTGLRQRGFHSPELLKITFVFS